MKKGLFCYLSVLAYIPLLAISNVLASSVLMPGDIPLIRIDTEKRSPLEIGLEAGRQNKVLFPDIERRYDAHLAASLNQALFDQIQRERLPSLIKELDSAYQEELKGVAGAWSLTRANKLGDGLLSWDEYQVLNFLPDIGLSADGISFSVINNASAENGPIVGRNLDLISTPELRSLQTITVYQGKHKTMVNVGFAGIISVLTGFNGQGLFLAHYNAEPSSPSRNMQRPSNSLSSSVFDLRKVLETGTSTQQAVRYLAKKSYAYSHSILMSDKAGIQILEYPQGGTAKVRNWNSPTRQDKPWGRKFQIALIDCHVLVTMPNNCKDIKDSFQWERLRHLARFSATNPASVRDIANILFDTANHLFEIFNQHTLQSMIYLPANNSLYLYTATIDGSLPTSPVHKAYLELLPSEIRNSQRNSTSYVTWLTGFVLLVLSALVLWLTLQNKKKKDQA